MMNWTGRWEEWTSTASDARGPYDIDYGRVIHSASFRRLQGKTQILNLGDSDFYRTRLTHSLEVEQIGAGIVRQLRHDYSSHPVAPLLPETNLINTICLTHDLGHPPFGHGGEVALNYCMREAGGFEANGQSLRILSKIEKYSSHAGANLTRRALLGILKYPVSLSVARNPRLTPKLSQATSVTNLLDRNLSKPPKCFHDSEQDVVDWMLEGLSMADRYMFQRLELADHKKHRKPLHKSLDCSIMDVADDIAYGIHDLEDVIALGLVDQESFRQGVPEAVCSAYLDVIKARQPNKRTNDVYNEFVSELFKDGGSRKRHISRMVGFFVMRVEPFENQEFSEPILRYRAQIKPEVRGFLDALKKFVTNQVIKSPNVQHLEFKGQQMVMAVFEAFITDPASFLPTVTLQRFDREKLDVRVICDYVAGMTDQHLLRTYERLFSPRMGSVFDLL